MFGSPEDRRFVSDVEGHEAGTWVFMGKSLRTTNRSANKTLRFPTSLRSGDATSGECTGFNCMNLAPSHPVPQCAEDS
jgi:hypothetical protein